METKHTPGPWQVDELAVGSIEAADGSMIAQAMQRVPLREDLHQLERRANARLIAAAPELLAALIAARTELELFAKDDGEYYNNPALNAAIAKATGAAA